MAKIKLNELKKAGKELCKLFWEDDKEAYEIQVTAKEPDLRAQLKEAIKELEDGEMETLTETTQNVLKALKEEDKAEKPKPSKKEEEKEPAIKVDDLKEEIEEAGDDIDELKDIIGDHTIFKPLKKGLNMQKNADKLKAKMFDLLGIEPDEAPEETSEAPQKEKAKDKKASKDKEKEKKTSPPKDKAMNRVASVCLALKEEPESLNDWVEKANEIIEENGGSPNVQEARYHARNIIKMAPYFDFGVEVPEA
jgi:hypothetical protein